MVEHHKLTGELQPIRNSRYYMIGALGWSRVEDQLSPWTSHTVRIQKSLSAVVQDPERNEHNHNLSFMALSGIVVEGCHPSLSRKLEVSLCPFTPLDIVSSVTICNSGFRSYK